MSELDIFYFKQFSIFQNEEVFRIGTDAVLLACWIHLNDGDLVLDIGTGTGVIPLMLAQRASINVDAIDTNKNAVQLAEQNFHHCNLEKRMHAYHSDFSDWALLNKSKYNHIISNPPFFSESLRPVNAVKDSAKHTERNFSDRFLSSSSGVLLEKGKISVIIPFQDLEKWKNAASDHGLSVIREMHIRPTEEKKNHRALIQFSKILTEMMVEIERLTIFNPEENRHTEAYSQFISLYLPGKKPVSRNNSNI
ncbi:MAG: methyltransferase [Bacteroidota bacterium]